MEKEFVPYELALRMKGLGFDEPCLAHFYFGDELVIEVKERHHESDSCCLVPTWKSAFRWFREKYNLVFNFISYSIAKPGEYHWSITWNDESKASGIVKTYEEAELACLEKLIEIVEQKQK